MLFFGHKEMKETKLLISNNIITLVDLGIEVHKSRCIKEKIMKKWAHFEVDVA